MNSKEQLKAYKGIITMVIGFLVLFLLLKKTVLLYLAAGIFSVSALSPIAIEFIYKWWMKLAMLLGKINSTILLTLIFFVLLTPIAWLYRLFNKDPLQLKKNFNKPSYFISRNHTYTKADLEKMW
jgi:uncharacterized membrane protein